MIMDLLIINHSLLKVCRFTSSAIISLVEILYLQKYFMSMQRMINIVNTITARIIICMLSSVKGPIIICNECRFFILT